MVAARPLRVIALALPILFSQTASSVESSRPRRLDAPAAGVEIGYGWNSLQERSTGSRCVRAAPVHESGQIANVEMYEVSDQSEIMDRLGVSASLALKSAFAQGSVKGSFAKQSKVSASQSNLLLRATVQNGVLFAGPENPGCVARSAFPPIPGERPSKPWWDEEGPADLCAPDALSHQIEIIEPGGGSEPIDDEAFFTLCGDSFVSAIYSGAELLATISISETEREESQKIAAALKASFGKGQVKIEGKVEDDHEDKAKHSELSIHFTQVGGGGGLLPISREGLTSKLQSLALEAAQQPKFIAIEVTPYSALGATRPGGRGGHREISSDYYWFLTTLEDEIEEILDAPERYDWSTGLSPLGLREFQDVSIKLRETIRSLEARAESLAPALTADAADDSCNQHDVTDVPTAYFGGLPQLLEAANSTSPLQLRRALREATPFCDPNLLRLYLPVPYDASSAGAAHAIDVHVRRLSLRMCQLDPRDNECLTNAQMDAVARGLEERPLSAGFLLENEWSGECLRVIDLPSDPDKRDPQAGPLAEPEIKKMDVNLVSCADATPFRFFWRSDWTRHEPLGELPNQAPEYALVFDSETPYCLGRASRNVTEGSPFRALLVDYTHRSFDYKAGPAFCGWSFHGDGRIESRHALVYKPGRCLTKTDGGRPDVGKCDPDDRQFLSQLYWRRVPISAFQPDVGRLD